ENYFTLTDGEDIAAHVYYALDSLNEAGETAVSGESILSIPAIKGGVPMDYDGISAPTLTGRPPIYSDWGLGSISFDNEPLVRYIGDIPNKDTPVEVSLTLLRQPGVSFEAWYNQAGVYA